MARELSIEWIILSKQVNVPPQGVLFVRTNNTLFKPTEKVEEHSGEIRLDNLASFQQKMIKHAMRCELPFQCLSPPILTGQSGHPPIMLPLSPVPSVEKIVYSTCSVHAIENEGVVRNILNSEECKIGKFRLAPQNEVLATWPRRGSPEELDSPGESLGLRSIAE